jgi:hypothetical protein
MRFSEFINLQEIDWKGAFKDVNPICIDPKKLVDYLNDVRKNAELEYKDREKFSPQMPFIHSKSSFFKDTKKGIDVEYFKNQMLKKPTTVINTNEKMLKSGGLYDFVYKTGIPAFRGIVFDIEKDKFVFINTCPGAGECRTICYALKGRYVQYPNAYDSMTRRLNLLLNNPQEYEFRLYKELKEKCIEHEAFIGYENKLIMRWNDSGDFFSQKYVEIAQNVTNRLKSEGYNVQDYAYTKIADVASQSKIGNIVFSQGGKKSESEKSYVSEKGKNISMARSYIIPRSSFVGLNLSKIVDKEILKNRISNDFKIDKKTILTYFELMKTPEGKKRKWNVIVTPNDGDDAATRKDVIGVFLTEH